MSEQWREFADDWLHMDDAMFHEKYGPEYESEIRPQMQFKVVELEGKLATCQASAAKMREILHLVNRKVDGHDYLHDIINEVLDTTVDDTEPYEQYQPPKPVIVTGHVVSRRTRPGLVISDD